MRIAPTIRTTTAIALAAMLATAALSLAACSVPTGSADASQQQSVSQAPAVAPVPAHRDPSGAAATAPTSVSPEQARQLIAQKCGVGCHPADAVLNNPTKDAQAWDAIFTNMQQRGAQVTPEQKQAMIAYLVGR